MSPKFDPDPFEPSRSSDGLATTTLWLIAALVLFVATVVFLQTRI